MGLFTLRGTLSTRTNLLLAVGGVALVIVLWFLLTRGEQPLVPGAILPKPFRVLTAFSDLSRDNELFRNICRSLGINFAGYIEAILISVPLGFLIGLLPLFRGGFQRQVESIRYVPLTAVTGLFIVWFGIGADMKVHFLAFGILIYLLPVVVQRIDDVSSVYLKTVYTLGATPWQTVRTVYIPAVLSKLLDDIRVLTAISWTYIIVAENIDSSQGGIGALIWRVGQRQGRIDKVFALLIIIILIGVLQDRLFIRLDRALFPYKEQADAHLHRFRESAPSVLVTLWHFVRKATAWILLSAYWILFLNEYTGWLFPGKVYGYLFGDTAWAIHGLAWAVTAWFLHQGWLYWMSRTKRSMA